MPLRGTSGSAVELRNTIMLTEAWLDWPDDATPQARAARVRMARQCLQSPEGEQMHVPTRERFGCAHGLPILDCIPCGAEAMARLERYRRALVEIRNAAEDFDPEEAVVWHIANGALETR